MHYDICEHLGMRNLRWLHSNQHNKTTPSFPLDPPEASANYLNKRITFSSRPARDQKLMFWCPRKQKQFEHMQLYVDGIVSAEIAH